MKVQPHIRLEDGDFNRLFNVLGWAYRQSESYDDLIVALKEAATELAQEAFCRGAEYALLNKDLW